MQIQDTFGVLVQAFSIFIIGLIVNMWKDLLKVSNPDKVKEFKLNEVLSVCFLIATYKTFGAIGDFFGLGYIEKYLIYFSWVFPFFILAMSYSLWFCFRLNKYISSYLIFIITLFYALVVFMFSVNSNEALNYSLIYILGVISFGFFVYFLKTWKPYFLISCGISLLQVIGLFSLEFDYDPYGLGLEWLFSLSLCVFSLIIFLFVHYQFNKISGKYIKKYSMVNVFLAWFAVFFFIFFGYMESFFYGDSIKEDMAYIEMGIIAAIIVFSFYFKNLNYNMARYIELQSIEKTMELLNGIETAAILSDRKGKTEEANKSAFELFQKNSIDNIPLWEFMDIPKKFLDKIFIDKKNNQWNIRWNIEKNGEKRYLEGTIRLISNNSKIITTVIDQTDKKIVESELDKLSKEDSLTKLSNRRDLNVKLKEKIEKSIKHKENFYLAFADIDLLKKVNDIAGHIGGDKFLIFFSNQLKKISLVYNLFVARFAGDEFIIVFPSNMTLEEINSILLEIKKEAMKPFVYNNMKFNLDLSIGIACFPKDANTAEELISNADVALNKAKENGYGNIVYYGKSMAEELAVELRLESLLKESFKTQKNIFQYYQPQFSTKDKTLVGAESLFRFYDKSIEKFISPAIAIAIAEKVGLDWELGRWSLEQAIITANDLKKINKTIKISVNVSTRQFDDVYFLDRLEELAIKENATQKIKIEITESSLIKDIEKAKNILNDLVSLGYTISIDDFGVGYSSLSYILNFPFAELKLDKSFIDDIGKDNGAETLIKASLFIAKNKNMNVVAEGVENEAQFNWLKENGCDVIQGYYLGKPMTKQDFFNIL